MDTSDLISIIIPAYNAEKFIVKTINSIASQSYNNIEIIIINDGSSDNTEAKIKQLQSEDNRIKLFSQHNCGIAATRNKGIRLACGEFVVFVDSDDDLHPDFLSKMVQRQKQTKGEVIYSGFLKVMSKGCMPRLSDFREQNQLVGFLEQKSLVHIGCFLISRSFLLDHSLFFDESLRTGEDILFICSLFCHINAYAVPEYLYYYQYRTDSIMNSQWTKQHYELDIQAWINVQHYILQHYCQADRENVLALLETKLLYYRLRYLWLLLRSNKHFELREHLDNGFLSYSVDAVNMLPRKYIYRKKIIESKKGWLWKTITFVPTKQNIIDA